MEDKSEGESKPCNGAYIVAADGTKADCIQSKVSVSLTREVSLEFLFAPPIAAEGLALQVPGNAPISLHPASRPVTPTGASQ
jgi:hypothetical protein